jgi:hypothetical protein
MRVDYRGEKMVVTPAAGEMNEREAILQQREWPLREEPTG